MCDKSEFLKLRDRVDALEKTDVVHDVKLASLTKLVTVQSYTVWAAFFLVLFALIYGALGPNGFKAVREVAPAIMGGDN